MSGGLTEAKSLRSLTQAFRMAALCCSFGSVTVSQPPGKHSIPRACIPKASSCILERSPASRSNGPPGRADGMRNLTDRWSLSAPGSSRWNAASEQYCGTQKQNRCC